MMDIQKPKESIICENFVNGKWMPGDGKSLSVSSPYFGEDVGEISCASEKFVAAGIDKINSAQKNWEATPIKERCKVMFQFREILLRDIEKIAQRVSLENGKTLGESKAGLLKGIEVLEYALSLQNSDQGGRMEVSRGVHCEYRRKPVGVVANITPFNFPAMVPMWTIPICLTLGNAYIWKPSEKTPLTSQLITNALVEAGLPPEVFQVYQGDAETVNSIIDHPLVKAIGFVGSSKVADLVYQRGTKQGKRVLALGGAKNHIVLLPDADPKVTAKGISDSFTGCAGQRCMAASVLLAVGDVNHLVNDIKSTAEANQLGDSMGAIITKEQVEFLSQAIDTAEKEGAKILLDGRKQKPPTEFSGGFWIGPTILDNVKPDSQAAREELFGPILSIVRCKDISEAMKIENANPYGNACSVFTSNGGHAERVLKSATAGMLGVNIGVPVPREPFSFGGINYSKFGSGDITGDASLNFWSDLIKVTTKWENQSDDNWMS